MTIHLPAETAVALAMALTDTRYDLSAKRTAAEKAIEDLINFLDDTEGDPDLEESVGFDALEGGDVQDERHDEIDEDGRDVSWPEAGPSRLTGAWATEDDEDDDVSEEDGTAEPSLAAPEIAPTYMVKAGYSGWTERQGNQERWAQGNRDDGENNVEDEGEAVNEDGGNILDEPHDAEQDYCTADEMAGYKRERGRPAAPGVARIGGH